MWEGGFLFSEWVAFSNGLRISVFDYICSIAKHYKVYYLWRPFLRDPKNDMALELGVVSNANYIVTLNTADFKGIEKFGLRAIKPRDFLKEIGELL